MVKAKEFSIPFTWEKRHIVIQDGVWFLPPRVFNDPFVFSGWNQLFSNPDRPVRIEYCSGNGTWLVERAKSDPHSNWLAVEKQFARARLIWARAKNAKLDNVAVAFAEGVELTQRFLPAASVSEVFINFPDPWPKRRHAKHRLVRAEFVQELGRILHPAAHAILVTDNEEYSQIMIHEMKQCPLFQSAIGEPYFEVADAAAYGTSFFDSLFRTLCKTIRLHRFVRI